METPGADETNTTEPETAKGTGETTSTRSSEDDLVLLIVILTFVFLIILAVYVWINRRSFGFEGPGYVMDSVISSIVLLSSRY
jgi:uncharacterized integral membrane protein